MVAHRTSPTNMGLSLLANLTAYDFGYIPAGQLLLRTANAMGTMATLERYEGHFYNWYDTQSGKPLPPLYVSSVDSGNLAGHLMTLRPGLAALADDRIIELRWFEGLTDTLRALADAIGGTAPAPLARLRRDLETAYDSRPASIAAAREWLERLATGVVEVAAYVAKIPGAASASETAAASESAFWVAALDRQCRTLLDELAFLVPWSALPAAPEGSSELPGLRGIPTLRELAALEAQLLRGIEQGGRAAASPADRAGPGRSLPGCHRSESSRRAADGGNRAPGAAMRCARPDGVRLPLRSGSAFAGHRVQRRRASARPELLRFARLRSAIREFRGDRAGTAAAGELVRARAPSHVLRRPASPPVVERLDVRVPDAAPRDAHVREHAARPDGSRFGGAPDRLREAARRALGHFGMRLQLRRCEPQLPIPRVRSSGPGIEARARGRSRRRALCVGAGDDRRAGGVVPQSAAPRSRRARGKIRLVRGHRLHARPPAARAAERRRAFVHGASPGHDPAFARACAARAPDAAALRIGPAVQGHAPVAAGARSEGRRALFAPRRAVRDTQHFRRRPKRRCASSSIPTRRCRRCSSCRTAVTT